MPSKKNSSNQVGQGLLEYLIVVALIAISAIAILRTMGSSLNRQLARVTLAIQGGRQSLEGNNPEVSEGQYKKRDLGDFVRGASDGQDR